MGGIGGAMFAASIISAQLPVVHAAKTRIMVPKSGVYAGIIDT